MGGQGADKVDHRLCAAGGRDGRGHGQQAELSPTLFNGELLPPIKSDSLRVSGDLIAKLVDREHAVVTFWLRIGAAPGASPAVLAAIGMADCRTTAVYDFRNSWP